jgi:hypothetical protein
MYRSKSPFLSILYLSTTLAGMFIIVLLEGRIVMQPEYGFLPLCEQNLVIVELVSKAAGVQLQVAVLIRIYFLFQEIHLHVVYGLQNRLE